MTKLKEALKTQTKKLDEVNRQFAHKVEKLMKAREEVEWLKKDNKGLNKDNKELRALLKEALLKALFDGNGAFDKVKAQALVLQPNLNLDEIDLLKVIQEGQLVYP